MYDVNSKLRIDNYEIILDSLVKPVPEGYFTTNRQFVPMRKDLIDIIHKISALKYIEENVPYLNQKVCNEYLIDLGNILESALNVLKKLDAIFGLTEPSNGIRLIDIEVNDKVKFNGDNRWYTVQARNDDFIICNHVGKNDTYHTIVDVKKGIRGADNLIFHSGYFTQEDCINRLREFVSGELEVSYRNRVHSEVIKRK